MSSSSAQSWTRRIRTGYYDNMRVSDAERAEVADLLGRHYSDGRLDRQEFDERVARAMSAKTRADLNGLFDDLPDLDDGAGAEGRDRPGGQAGPARPYRAGRRRGGRSHPVLLVVAAIILASVAWHAFVHAFFFAPWFAIIALVAIVALASSRSRRSRS